MSEKRFTVESTMVRECILDNATGEQLDTFDYTERLCELLNKLSEENGQLKKANNILYNENIQLRRILVNYKDLINDVKYLEEKGVFDGGKDKKNIWDVEPVVEKHS